MPIAEIAVERDTFMSASEALKWGLIDSILEKRPPVTEAPQT